MKHALVLLICCLSLTAVQGQEISSDSVTYLPEVILVDPAKDKLATGITPSNVIRGKFFQNQSPLDLTATINQISGVHILTGALNTNRITIRGVGARTPFGTDKLKLYFDGIPVTNGTGFSALESYDLESLYSLEIIKGPKGTAFGSALGGAMLLTSEGNAEAGNRLENHFSTGSYGLIKENLNFSHEGKQLSIALNYGHTDIDGYRENSKFSRDGLLFRTSYRVNERNSFSLLINYIDYTAQIASSISESDFKADPRQAAFTWKESQGYEAVRNTLTGLSHTHNFSSKLKTTNTLFYSYQDNYEPRPFNILDEFTNGYGFRSQWLGNFTIAGKELEYGFGAELYKDEYSWGTFENDYEENNGNGSIAGDQLSDNKEYRRQFSGFGTVTIPITERFITQLGLNVNKTHYDFRDLMNTGVTNKNAKRNFDPVAMPSLEVSYLFKNRSRLYGNISRGFSNPSLEETLTPEGIINPDIEQEIGVSYEAGAKIYWPTLNLWIDMTLYRMNINNLLVAERVGEDQFIGRNAGKTKHQGVELQVDYNVNITGRLKFSPFAGYTLNDHSFVTFIDDGNDYSGNPLTGVPRHRVHSGMRWDYARKLYWTSSYQYVSAIPLTDANTVSSEGYGILNTRLGYLHPLTNKFSIGLDIGANNLMNIRYAQSVLINAVGFGNTEPRFYYPGNNRNYYGGLQLNYAF